MNLLESEETTIAWIDKYNRDIVNLRKRISANHHLADSLRDTVESYRVPDLRRECQMIEKRIDWRFGRLKKLGARLAEQRTEMLPHMEDTYAPPANVDRNPF